MTQPIPVRYVGALHDTSGYASAARNYVDALIDHPDVDLALDVASFEQQKTNHGAIMEKMVPLIGKEIMPKVNIVHLTPENFPVYKRADCYNIAYTVWETERLPDFWIELCNSMDEIWVPSEWNCEVFKNSGVTKPIICVPHIIHMPDDKPYKLNQIPVNDDAFKFYSIFQWLERKNPSALLRAYFTEFTNAENVCLVLKTYRMNFTPIEKNIVKSEIQDIKRSLNLENYPPIAFFGDLMTSEYLAGLHHQCDCFVMAQRGEGFGIPFAEAMSYGNPTIATKYGGNLQFMHDQNSFLVNCTRTPVYKMLFNNYNGNMVWAEPDIMDLRAKMRYVYEHQEEAKVIGALGKTQIRECYSKEHIGNHMVNRIKQIIKEKNL